MFPLTIKTIFSQSHPFVKFSWSKSSMHCSLQHWLCLHFTIFLGVIIWLMLSPRDCVLWRNKDQVSLFSPLHPGTRDELACCRSEWTTNSLKMLRESRIVHLFLKCFQGQSALDNVHMINVSLNRNKTFQILICWSGWIIQSPVWFWKLDHS